MNRDLAARRKNILQIRRESAKSDRAATRPRRLRTPTPSFPDRLMGNAAPSSRKQTGTMRVSVGIDLTSVAEVAAALDRFGDRYVRRTFTMHEASYCRAGAGPVAARRFAARFAAKEAAVKALAPTGPWSNWRAIEVRRQKSGRCTIVLRGAAAALAVRRGIARLSLSMTHADDHAAAIVVAVSCGASTHPER
jgi:holo-[acyl-carrier protein] synthase